MANVSVVRWAALFSVVLAPAVARADPPPTPEAAILQPAPETPRAADAPESPAGATAEATAPPNGDCQAFGPNFFKPGYDLRFIIGKDGGDTVVNAATARLPTAMYPNGGIPLLGFAPRDVYALNRDVHPGLDAQVNMAFAAATDFGPLTGFINIHGNGTFIANGSPAIQYSPNTASNWRNVVDLAWIKVAGFTLGVHSSYFNFTESGYTLTNGYSSSARTPMICYSRRVGDNAGFSVSIEDPSRRYVEDGVLARYAPPRMPDLVGQARVGDRSFLLQIAGAYHAIRDRAAADCCAAPAGTANGWAAMAGGEYRWNWRDLVGLAAGDTSGRFMATAAYASGAVAYLGASTNLPDYVSEASGRIHPSAGWSTLASYEHRWTPALRSMATFAYYDMSTRSDPSDAGAGRIVAFSYRAWGSSIRVGTEFTFQPKWMVGFEAGRAVDSVKGTLATFGDASVTAPAYNVLLYLRTSY